MIVQNHLSVIADNTVVDRRIQTRVIVESHFSYNDRVWLIVDGVRLLVAADELKRAVDNACNHK